MYKVVIFSFIHSLSSVHMTQYCWGQSQKCQRFKKKHTMRVQNICTNIVGMCPKTEYNTHLSCTVGTSQHCLRNSECTLIVVELCFVEKAQIFKNTYKFDTHTRISNIAFLGHPNNFRNSTLVLANYLTHTAVYCL